MMTIFLPQNDVMRVDELAVRMFEETVGFRYDRTASVASKNLRIKTGMNKSTMCIVQKHLKLKSRLGGH